MKDKQLLLAVCGTLALGALAFWYLRGQAPSEIPAQEPAPEESLGLRVGPNALVVQDQRPGKAILVSFVGIEGSGFVTIHADGGGKPGDLLGVSALVAEGATDESVKLSRATRDGETLYAVLRKDDGDGMFDASDDEIVKDFQGNDLVAVFTTSKDAPEVPPSLLL
jgi:hypothetical protein